MSTPMRWPDTTTTLLTGVAGWFAALGLAIYDESGYDPNDGLLPVLYLQQAHDTPDHAVTIWCYSGPERGTHDETSVAVWRIQVDHRVPRDVPSLHIDRMADLTYDRLHAVRHVKLPNGTRVLHCTQVIRGQAELDESGRYHRADSYELITNPGEFT